MRFCYQVQGILLYKDTDFQHTLGCTMCASGTVKFVPGLSAYNSVKYCQSSGNVYQICTSVENTD